VTNSSKPERLTVQNALGVSRPLWANTTDSVREGLVQLRRERPRAELPDVRRVWGEIDEQLRVMLDDLAFGHCPWPLYLWGPAGSGKTRAALCMIDRWGGWYTTAREFVSQALAAYRGELTYSTGYRRTEKEFWLQWSDANLVVLDELATREASDYVFETVKHAIDAREGRPLIGVSNLSLNDLHGTYDDRVASRLAAGTVYRLQCSDRRLEKAPRTHRNTAPVDSTGVPCTPGPGKPKEGD
jgi:hypothetical protein